MPAEVSIAAGMVTSKVVGLTYAVVTPVPLPFTAAVVFGKKPAPVNVTVVAWELIATPAGQTAEPKVGTPALTSRVTATTKVLFVAVEEENVIFPL